jgi:hypothetical protein
MQAWGLLMQLFQETFLLLFKAIFGGVFCVLSMWIAIVMTDTWKLYRDLAKQGMTGRVAIAGGWAYLIQLPGVVVLVSLAFGVGFYLVARWSVRLSIH